MTTDAVEPIVPPGAGDLPPEAFRMIVDDTAHPALYDVKRAGGGSAAVAE
jgi:hypothetical protein